MTFMRIPWETSSSGSASGRYAAWISSLAGSNGPQTVFEIGCGNGSLFMELQAIWPSASFVGLEPAAAAGNHARQAGFAVTQGFFKSGSGPTADLVLSVNVLEHSSDTRHFLEYFRDRIAVSGRGILVCRTETYRRASF